MSESILTKVFSNPTVQVWEKQSTEAIEASYVAIKTSFGKDKVTITEVVALKDGRTATKKQAVNIADADKAMAEIKLEYVTSAIADAEKVAQL